MALVFSPRCVNVSKRNAHIKFLKIFFNRKAYMTIISWKNKKFSITNPMFVLPCFISISPLTVLEMWVKPLWIQFKNFWRFWLFFVSCTHLYHYDEKFFNSTTSLSKKFTKTLKSKQSNKQKAQYSVNMNVLGAYTFFCGIIRLLESGKSEPTQTSDPYVR